MSNPTLEALTVAVKAGLPIALRGRPGVGKTSMIESVAKQLDLDCEVVIGSLREPSDFAGLPVVRADGTVSLAPPSWAVRAQDSFRGCVVLLDELTTASPAVQAAMLRVVRERVAGDLKMDDGVRIVAAYNDARDCGGYELELPMRSRMIHLDVAVDSRNFVDGLLNGWESQRVMLAGRPGKDCRSKWTQLVATFIQVRPGLLEVDPQPHNSGGYPCPRSWSLVIEAAAAAENLGASDDARLLLVSGAIGAGAASEFFSWFDNLDLPDPAAVLANPSLVSQYLETGRPDRALIVLSSVVDLAIERKTAAAWTNAWIVESKAVEAGFGDIVGWTGRRLVRHRPTEAKLPPEFERVKEFLVAA